MNRKRLTKEDWERESRYEEKLDFERLIYEQIRLCQEASISDSYTPYRNSIKMLWHMIPKDIMDIKFREDMEKAKYFDDVRHTYFNDLDLTFRAIINLLQRKGLLFHKISKEAI